MYIYTPPLQTANVVVPFFRRDTIVTRGDAQAKIAARTKSKDKTVTKGTFQRQLAELRKKIKTTIQVMLAFIFHLHLK